MFEIRVQTYWGDADAAGRVFFPNFFRFVECAEEELFRAAGIERLKLFEESRVWMPRVEAFAKFSQPIFASEAVLLQVQTHFKGEKTVRMEFEILSVHDRSLIAQGYVTAVCIDRASGKSRPLPPAIREGYARAAGQG
jgi:YbgC/YbaW family acyl-CoA thioester hydrolase